LGEENEICGKAAYVHRNLSTETTGLNISQIARKLNISQNTVYKYLDMSPEEMQTFVESVKTRRKKLDSCESQILQWLREYPDLSAAQIHDWLKERHLDTDVCESTVRNFVRQLRERHNKKQAHAPVRSRRRSTHGTADAGRFRRDENA
jgi:transposase